MDRFEAERTAAGLSVEKLADVMGVHPNTVRGWEHGDFEPNGRNLIQMSAFYGCTPDYLLGLTDDRNQRVVGTK